MYALPAISSNQKIALATGYLAFFFANQSINALAIPYYQMTIGIDPFLLGLVMTLPIIISAQISPTVGHWSDNLNSRWGRRKPFILLSGWLAGLLFGCLWMAPSHWSENTILIYLSAISILFYIAATFLTINVKCIAYEAGNNSYQTTLIMSYTTIFERIGSTLHFWLFPLAQLPIWTNIFVGIQYVGWIVGIGIIGLFSSLTAYLSEEKKENKHSQTPPLKSIHTAKPIQNKNIKIALYILLSLTIIKLGAVTICSSLDFYLLVYYVKAGDVAAGAYWKGILSSCFAIFGLILIPVVTHFSLKFGKINTLIGIYLLSAFGGIAKWFIYIPGREWSIIIDAMLGAASWVAISAIIPAMLADLADKNKQITGNNQEGYFVSAHNKIVNLSIVTAIIGTGVLLNLIGFDANLKQPQNEQTILSMRLILSVGTCIFSLIPILIIKKYPFSDAYSKTIT